MKIPNVSVETIRITTDSNDKMIDLVSSAFCAIFQFSFLISTIWLLMRWNLFLWWACQPSWLNLPKATFRPDISKVSISTFHLPHAPQLLRGLLSTRRATRTRSTQRAIRTRQSNTMASTHSPTPCEKCHVSTPCPQDKHGSKGKKDNKSPKHKTSKKHLFKYTMASTHLPTPCEKCHVSTPCSGQTLHEGKKEQSVMRLTLSEDILTDYYMPACMFGIALSACSKFENNLVVPSLY
jgi:hypothetical protein